jgi:hypothetical protein
MYGSFINRKMIGPIVAAGAVPPLTGANWPWIIVAVISAITMAASVSALPPWRRKMF